MYLSMGGYGLFVWSVYLVTIVVLVWLGISPILARRREIRRMRRREVIAKVVE